MSMHAHIAPASSPKCADGAPRSAKRTRVLMVGTLVSPIGLQKVRIRDISTTGALVIAPKEIAVGCDALLQRGSLFAVARVAWIRGDEVGPEFYRGLSATELEECMPGSLP